MHDNRARLEECVRIGKAAAKDLRVLDELDEIRRELITPQRRAIAEMIADVRPKLGDQYAESSWLTVLQVAVHRYVTGTEYP